MKTRSEKLFEIICQTNNIDFMPIETGENKSPDYRIYPSEKEVIVEVKQINLNTNEKVEEEKLQQGGIAIGGGTPGHRVRKKTTDASPQIVQMAKGKYPSILVLYNNVYLAYHTDPYHVRVGMYGIETVILDIPKDNMKKSYIVGRKFGSKQKMTQGHNTSISALGVIQLDPLGDLTSPILLIYHNVYAAIPLPPECIHPYGIKQFRLLKAEPGKYQEWDEIKLS